MSQTAALRQPGAEGEEETPKKKGEYKAEYASSWAAVIGINNYRHATKLNYAVVDAVGIAKILVSRLGFAPQNVLAILDPAPEIENPPYKLVSSKASKEAIERLLKNDLPTKASGKDDRVLIFYAGHGESRALPNGEARGYLVPASANLEDWSTLIDLKTVIEAGEFFAAKHIFYLLDACYSGLATTRATVKPTPYEATMLTHKARQVLTAGNATEVVADKGPGGHSPFTDYVLRGLGGDSAPEDSDIITATNLMVYVKDMVGRRHGEQQTPDMGALPGQQSGGDFVFRLPQLTFTPEDHASLGCLLYDLGRQLDDPGRYESAILHIEEALEAQDLSEEQAGRAEMYLGKTKLITGDATGAVEALVPLVQHHDSPAEALMYLGMAHARQDAIPSAREALKAFVAQNKDDENIPWIEEYLTWLENPFHGEGHALLIGANQYQAFPELGGCLNDVILMKDLLTIKGRFLEENIDSLLDTLATRENTLAALQKLQRVGPSDAVIIFYSGHSVPEVHRNAYGITNDTEVYLVLHDTDNEAHDISNGGEVSDSISAKELHNLVKAIPALNKTLILDTHPSFELIELCEKEGNYTLLLASDSAEVTHEKALELDGRSMMYGLFTFVLADKLRSAVSQKVTFGELVGATIEGIKAQGLDQTPVFVGDHSDGLLFRETYLRLFDFAQRRTWPAITLAEVRRRYKSLGQQVMARHPMAYRAFGKAFLEKGDWAAAIEALEMSLQQSNCEESNTQLALVRAQLEAGRFADALDSVQHYVGTRRVVDSQADTDALLSSVEACITPCRHALLVGISKYADPRIPDVPGAANDVRKVEKTLKSRMAFPGNKIKILEDEDASRTNILKHFRHLAKMAQDEPALFYFAGRGSLTSEGDRTLISADGRIGGVEDIYHKELQKELQAIVGDQGTNLVAIIDAGSESADLTDPSIRFLPFASGSPPSGSNKTRHVRLSSEFEEMQEKRRREQCMGLVVVYPQSARDETGDGGESSGQMTAGLMEVVQRVDPDSLTYANWLEQSFPESKRRPMMVGEGQGERVFSNTVRKNDALSAITHIDQSPIREAIELLRRLITSCERVGQSAPEALLDLGVAYAAVGDRESGIKQLDRAADLFDDAAIPKDQLPDDSDAARHRAEAHYQLGRILYDSFETDSDLNRAISHLSEATEQEEFDNFRAFYYHGQALHVLVERTTLADAYRSLRTYLSHGAPLGHEDEVRRILGTRPKPAERQ